MQITSVYPNVSPYIGNPAVDQARRENLKREIIEPVAQAERNAAEKGVISEDKSRNNANLTHVSLSEDARQRGTELKQAVEGRDREPQEREPERGSQQEDKEQPASQRQMSAEQREIAELKKRDAEVKAHEQAHAAVGGQLASSPSYSYEVGPDGQRYAVAGEVQIDLSEVPGDPQATILKMQQVKAAALAPAQPSSADRQVAAEAARRIAKAQAELVQEFAELNQPPAAAGDFDSVSGVARRQGREQDKESGGFFSAITTVPPRESFSPPENRALARDPLMVKRNEVLAGFYARATVPVDRPLLQIA